MTSALAVEQVTLFGIRHHGPGSARSLEKALTALQPDCVLVEGPPEANDLLAFAADAAMQPPVALLLYDPKLPERAVFFPFANFSPEWRAFHYAAQHKVPVRFFDLPHGHRLAEAVDETTAKVEPLQREPSGETLEETESEPDFYSDPLDWLGRSAGYADGESWWEHMVEQRRDTSDIFQAIAEAMTALREQPPAKRDPIHERREQLREAYMRKQIRTACKSYQRIAVVCGAWHVPALAAKVAAKDDNALLKGLPKIKLKATWVPWSYQRLSFASGYGAGVTAPGWYHHLWSVSPEADSRAARHITIGWLTRIAHLLRDQDLDCSSAHVIEAVRLAEALAAMRSRPLPGLEELDEAVRAVICMGDDRIMALIRNRLLVDDRLGAVPPEVPTVPLQQDFEQQQKSLRLKAEVGKKTLLLDLRKTSHLERSKLLHRLNLLDIRWGRLETHHGGKGTFHEQWRLEWLPDYSIDLISAALWGNTIAEAASRHTIQRALQSETLSALAGLIDAVLAADLTPAVAPVVARLQALAADESDIGAMMTALPALGRVLRYGDVRQTDTEQLKPIVDSLVTRLCIGLVNACRSLDDEAAAQMAAHIDGVEQITALLPNPEDRERWLTTLFQLAQQNEVNGLVAGRACRMVFDSGKHGDACRNLLLSALSRGSDPEQAGRWFEGFLRNSGTLLLHDDHLWGLIDTWLTELSGPAFDTVLPLVRRTLAGFSPSERRQIAERVKQNPAGQTKQTASASAQLDHERAVTALPLLRRLLLRDPNAGGAS